MKRLYKTWYLLNGAGWERIPDLPNMLKPKFIGMYANQAPNRQDLGWMSLGMTNMTQDVR